jgi:hypothetical protein
VLKGATTTNSSKYMNLEVSSPCDPVQLLGNERLYRVCIYMKPLDKGKVDVASRILQIGNPSKCLPEE